MSLCLFCEVGRDDFESDMTGCRLVEEDSVSSRCCFSVDVDLERDTLTERATIDGPSKMLVVAFKPGFFAAEPPFKPFRAAKSACIWSIRLRSRFTVPSLINSPGGGPFRKLEADFDLIGAA